MRRILLTVLAFLLLATPAMAQENAALHLVRVHAEDFIPISKRPPASTCAWTSTNHGGDAGQAPGRRRVPIRRDRALGLHHLQPGEPEPAQGAGPLQDPQHEEPEPPVRQPTYDPGNKHTVAYQWGTLGMLYDGAAIAGDQPSWGVMFDPGNRSAPLCSSTRCAKCSAAPVLHGHGREHHGQGPAEETGRTHA